MTLGYSISQWNYGLLRKQLEIEEMAAEIRAGGYGVEWWARGWGIPPLTEEHVARFAAASDGMRVSMHSEGISRVPMKAQIQMAQRIKAEVQVVHTGNLLGENGDDYDGARGLVAYAGELGVKLALENSIDDQNILTRLLEENESLGFCYDVGHGYRCNPIVDHTFFLKGIFRDRLCHLHLQDILPPDERDLSGGVGVDHFMIGTGTIPHAFWVALGKEIKRRDYQGIIVFELRPRNVIHLVTRSRAYVEDAWDVRQ